FSRFEWHRAGKSGRRSRSVQPDKSSGGLESVDDGGLALSKARSPAVSVSRDERSRVVQTRLGAAWKVTQDGEFCIPR
ncbi:unnamed protein product, partial [Sphenostylis stenocarpa]